MSVTSKFKTLNRPEKFSTLFYLVSGAVFLALLPFGVAPHVLLIGVLSLVTGAIVLTKKSWMLTFVAIQFITAMVFSLWTIFSVGGGSWVATAGLAVYAVLTLVPTLYLAVWRKTGI